MTVRRTCTSASSRYAVRSERSLRALRKRSGFRGDASWLTKARLDHLPGRRRVGNRARREALRGPGVVLAGTRCLRPEHGGLDRRDRGRRGGGAAAETAAETAASSAAEGASTSSAAEGASTSSAAEGASAAEGRLRRRRRLRRLRLLLLRRRLARRLPRTPPRGLPPRTGSRPARFRSRGSRERLGRTAKPGSRRRRNFQTPARPPCRTRPATRSLRTPPRFGAGAAAAFPEGSPQ